MTVNTVDQLELIVGPVRLPLKIEDSVHYFSLHYFEFQGKRWASAALNDLSELDAVPLRIESACFFGHVMHSQQCDCGFQLDEAFRRIVQRNGGLVIYGIDQDARGLGIEKHFRIYDYRQNHHLDTDEVYKRFHAPLDSRSYEAVAAILRFLDVEKILLMSNNRARLAFLRAEGFQVERDQIEAPLTRYNMATMMLEKEDLAYQWSFKTHSEWLRPLQDKVDGHPDSFAACIVKDNQAVVAEWQGADWNVALNLLATHEGGEDGNLVIYLSDLPRLDELALYASTGARFVVVPFAVIPDYLLSEAQRQGLKLQDWERNNQYRTARPQWRLTEHGRDAHVYQRGDERRVYRAGDAAAD
ncbi:hypothetical protein WT60_25875 [Burkholderia sp. MSMB617WGS]|uniref:hypothetical protein n=1 Tax=Burkholderia TaxID=32008 RepID=UPI000530EE50|nr:MULTISPECIES: hypothetical protein [Burkholderia]AOK50255.1 hypothetical protein WT60_25875 [Burkholderia sp. MSMB617WGS]KGS08081.1 GTP cyclohydrolase II family protein [Burkholderia sp. ABCPW 111]KWZ47453.1 hypothetical protein WS73_02375 [Burkholderia savannae]